MTMVDSAKRKPGTTAKAGAKREITYKKHVIRIAAYRLLAGGWVPQAEIVTNIPDGIRETLLTDKRTFPSQDKAEAAALTLAKRRINSI